MGFVTQFFIKPRKTPLVELPQGSFTVDGLGKILTCTVPGAFRGQIHAIATTVLAAQRAAREAQLPLTELTVSFEGLKLVARDLRGGAIIFLERQTELASPPDALDVDEHFGAPPPKP